MRYILFILILQIFNAGGGINKVATINKYKATASKAYANENYKDAVKKYKYLYDTLGVREDGVILNLGHALYKSKETEKAEKFYGMLVESRNNKIKSQAYQQIGKIQFEKKNYEQSLQEYKNALMADPSNEAARYDYELLKKYLAKNKNKQNNNKDQLEPSEFAKKIKKQSDQFVQNNQFMQAYYTMERGKEMDSTVNAYNDYIKRLLDVNEVEYKNTQKNNVEN